MTDELWPALPYEAWKDTYATLHMWTQVVGKVALAQAAPLNHSWAVALQVTPRGLSTRTLPHGRRYLENRIQFVHVDDMGPLIKHILCKTEPESQRLTIFNVAGSGEPLTFEQCIAIAKATLRRVPGQAAFRLVLRVLWELGISAIPPEAAPYMTGEYIMSTERLRRFLGDHYEDVIRYTISDAFADCFKTEDRLVAQSATG